MGCWNGTDMITFTPIMHGDPIRMIILRPCGTMSWEPVGPPVKGKYDDYGCIEHTEDGFGAEWLMEKIKIDQETRKELESYGCDGTNEVEIICRAVERGMVSVDVHDWVKYYSLPEEDRGRDIPKSKKHYATWMVHEETWQAMQGIEYECWGRTIEDEANDIKNQFTEKDDSDVLWQLRFSLHLRYLEDRKDIIMWAMDKAPERFNEIVDTLVELERVLVIIRQTRRELIPVTGAGMQQTQPRAHIAIAELAMRQAGKILQQECR